MKINLKTINANKARLDSLKSKLDTETINSIKDMKSIGGSANFYNQLIKDRIVSKQGNRYVWNPNIPVSHKLAKTLTISTAKSNAVYAQKQPTRIPAVSKVEVKTPTTVPKMQVVNTPNKIAKKKGYKFSFAWGLLKMESFK